MHSLAVGALAATCYSRLILLERWLDESLPQLESRIELEYSLLGLAEVGDYLALVPGASDRQVQARLRRGDRCFAARHHGRLVGVSWASTGRVVVPYLHARLTLRPDEAIVDGAYVAPGLRGLRVSSSAGSHRLRWLRAAGYRRVLAAVLPENTVAFLPPVKKLAYHRLGTAHSIGVGRWRRVVIRLNSDHPYHPPIADQGRA